MYRMVLHDFVDKEQKTKAETLKRALSSLNFLQLQRPHGGFDRVEQLFYRQDVSEDDGCFLCDSAQQPSAAPLPLQLGLQPLHRRRLIAAGLGHGGHLLSEGEET